MNGMIMPTKIVHEVKLESKRHEVLHQICNTEYEKVLYHNPNSGSLVPK